MRRLLWERYAKLFRPGDAVLDVGCGTGIDAGFLARTGVPVVGIDASPSMITQARTKLGVDPFKELVELRVLDIRDIGSLPAAGFDGIISAFASLNTVADLEAFALQATSLLRPPFAESLEPLGMAGHCSPGSLSGLAPPRASRRAEFLYRWAPGPALPLSCARSVRAFFRCPLPAAPCVWTRHPAATAHPSSGSAGRYHRPRSIGTAGPGHAPLRRLGSILRARA